MERNIASPALGSDRRSQQLIEQLERLEPVLGLVDPVVYFDYPLSRDTDDVLYKSRVLLISRRHGVVLFAVSGLHDPRDDLGELQGLDAQLVQLHSIAIGKLLKSRSLRRRPGELVLPVESFIYAPDLGSPDAVQADVDSQVVVSVARLEQRIRGMEMHEPLSPEQYAELRAVLEGAKALLRPRERDLSLVPPNSRAVILRDLEAEILNFDAEQRRAGFSIVNGPQRIRGLAGSGKTVVLALKAAHLHLNYPTAQVLVTFHTKSLYDHIKRLITRFYRQFNDRDPDWSKVHVRHAWGGKSLGGVYYEAAVRAGVPPATYSQSRGGLDGVVDALLRDARVEPHYDYVLIDEAQDFGPPFFRLCFELCRGGSVDRNVVWAYDDLQSLFNVRLKTPRDLFGTRDGIALVDLDRAQEQSPAGLLHDIVLRKCYRNPREILVCAHALGFGIYSDTIVQMLENGRHWEDVGYRVLKGGHPGEPTVVHRPAENSPLSISSRQRPDQLIAVHVAEDLDDELGWVTDEITRFVSEGFRPDDIMVIGLDDRNAKTYFKVLGGRLEASGILVNDVLADPYSQPSFVLDGHVTLGTVYRAKGNEAAVVFAVGVDALAHERRLRQARNKLFTAFTRTKGWLRISGIGDGAGVFAEELRTAMKDLPEMKFEYPNPTSVEILQRDLTDKQAKLQRLKDEVERRLGQLGLDSHEEEEARRILLSDGRK